MKISNEVMEILVQSTIEENKLFLPAFQLDRKLYLDVNKALESIGGKWNRKAKAHVFEIDPSDVLDEIINTGEYTDAKKEYQFFETPEWLAKKMVELSTAAEMSGMMLEPSAGKGAIAKYFPKNNIVLIELNNTNIEYLEKVFGDKAAAIYNSDFLLFNFIKDFQYIIMNPPFSKQQDVKHILHAWELLADGGTLVSVVSESPFFRENALSKEFRRWVEDNDVDVTSLDAGTFKESGTMVKTRLLVAKKGCNEN